MFRRRLLAFFIPLFFLCSLRAASQTVSFSVRNEPLEKVFQLIERQTGYYFTYTQELIASAPGVTLSVSGRSVDEVLGLLLQHLPLVYEISGKEIILKERPPGPKEKVFVVNGRIVDDSDRTPLAGAVITIKGGSTGTVSDKDGFFTLNGLSDQTVLVVSFVSYLPVEKRVGPTDEKRVGPTDEKRVGPTDEKRVGPTDSLYIGMRRENRSLDPVVINTGLYKRPVGNFTGAATTYSGDELRTVNPVNAVKALAVLDPGFRITENNAMGSDPNTLPVIQLRGANNLPSSLQGAGLSTSIPPSVSQGDIMGSYLYNPNQPLIIIDGFQATLQTLYDLDVNRIERITLLKDAAAAVAYGSKAANGVVVVETKKPAPGRLQVGYAVSMDVSAPDLSSYHLLDAAGLLKAQQSAGVYTDPNNNYANNLALQQWYDQRLYQVQRGVNTDWLAQPVRNGIGTSHNLGLSGGNEHMRFGLNLSYLNNEGVMKGSSRKTYTLNNYFGYTAGKFKFSNNTTVTDEMATNSPWGTFSSYARQFPFFSPADSNGHITKILEPSAASLGIAVPAPGGLFTNALYNSTLNVKDNTSYLGFDNTTTLEYAILRNLRLSGGLHLVNQLPGAEQYLPADHTSFVTAMPGGFGDLGSYTQTRGRNTVMESRAGLDFNERMGDHTLFVSVGGTAQSTGSTSTVITVNGIPNDDLGQLGMANGYNANDIKPVEGLSRTRSLSLYASGSYNYKERYTAEITANASGSSQFGSNNRIAPFYAAGAGWNIDKEHFFHPNRLIQQLRLRVSYGITGNQNFAAFLGQPIYQYNMTNNYRLQTGVLLQGYANPDLKWQSTDKWNIGVQTALLGSRINLSANYFIENTGNLVLPLGVEPSTGFTTYMDNLGATVNKGYEVTVMAVVVRDQRRNLFWSLNFNTGHYSNTIRSLSPAIVAYNKANDAPGVDQTEPLPRYQAGRSMTQIWAVPSLGIDPATGSELFRKLDGSTTYVWSAADKRPVGDATSKFKGAFGSNLQYKGFVLNIQMSFEYGGQEYNQTLEDLVENVNLSTSNADSRVLSGRWVQPGNHSSFKALSNTSITNATSRFVQDNNYLNASAITLGYIFPSSAAWVKSAHLSAPRLFITQNDVFRWSTIPVERGTDYPFARSVSIGLSANF